MERAELAAGMSTCPNTYFDCSTSRAGARRVLHARAPTRCRRRCRRAAAPSRCRSRP
jgi:hypothetical protein